jgi:hypothetical protein
MPRQPRSDREAAANMPHLSGLLRTSQIDRILNLTHGRGGYPDTTAFQVSVCTRLLDKALREWDQAREALIEHAEGKRQFGGLFDGISHFENFVRLARPLGALHVCAARQAGDGGVRLDETPRLSRAPTFARLPQPCHPRG